MLNFSPFCLNPEAPCSFSSLGLLYELQIAEYMLLQFCIPLSTDTKNIEVRLRERETPLFLSLTSKERRLTNHKRKLKGGSADHL